MKRLAVLAIPLLLVACDQSRTETAPPVRSAAIAPQPQPSPQIQDAQQRLRAQGLYNGPIDGLWGAETQAAVERFQRARRLQVTMRLDDPTMIALREEVVPPRTASAAPPLSITNVADVRVLQQRLKELGYLDGPIDGVWGPRTQRALERFQRVRGLPVGGINEATLAAMGLDPNRFVAAADTRPAPLEPAVVVVVQERLAQNGFSTGRADGKWGPQTQAAVERFQRSRRLEPTGTLDPQTAQALGMDPNNLSGSASQQRRRTAGG